MSERMEDSTMNKICERLEQALRDPLREQIGDVATRLHRLCESPIEIMLGSALLLVDRLDQPVDRLILARHGEEERHYGRDARLLIPQYEIEGYRLDFVLKEAPFLIAIECDGHDFHEKTKKQAARDRRRDRVIQQCGISVLRFTGSEIHRDPVHCASEVFEFISDQHMIAHIGRRVA